MRRRARGAWTLPEVLLSAAIMLAILLLVTSVFELTVGATNRTGVHLDVQLTCQEWLSQIADDLATGQDRRLFRTRCEIDTYVRSELVRFNPDDPDQEYDPSEKKLVLKLGGPAGVPAARWRIPVSAYNFDRGEAVTAQQVDDSTLELGFRTSPQNGDRLVVNYPVSELTSYWLGAGGRLQCERRDSHGETSLETLNPAGRRPDVVCNELGFEKPGPGLVTVSLRAGDQQVSWSASLSVAVTEP